MSHKEKTKKSNSIRRLNEYQKKDCCKTKMESECKNIDREINVLHVVPSLSLRSGVASHVMSYFRNINHSRVHIDFITCLNERSEYYDEIEKAGSKIYFIPKITLKNIFKTINQIKIFLKNHKNEYDIIHCHMVNMGAFYLYFAKKNKIDVRILHSHATKYADKFLNNLRNKILAIFAKKYATANFACSELAGKFMFKNKQFFVINNAIDSIKYEFNKNFRNEIRKEFNIAKETYLIGNIGRLMNQKNQMFLVDIAKNLTKESINFKLMIIGNGPLEEKLKKKTERCKLEDNIILVNSRNDVYKFYSAFDLFLLPSLYEGLPVVGVEAQCNGLPCAFATTISSEIKINNNVCFLDINNCEKWVELIKEKKMNRTCEKKMFEESGYDIRKEALKLEKIYYELKNE